MSKRITLLQLLPQRHRAGALLLAVCWLFGVLLGFCAALSAGYALLGLVRDATVESAPLFRVIAVAVIPFLLTALASLLRQHWLIYVLCFFKAFAFGFCAVSISAAYGSAGWLVRFLLLFSDYLTIPVMYYFCVRQIKDSAFHADINFVSILIYTFAVGAIDYCFIIPFLRSVVLS